ncbi:MAG: 3-phosphoglycerate dehydrogenase [Clostridia bacterium]|nr:3-phosphoglycerate dehydrogenase [Clostridia bacterium]
MKTVRLYNKISPKGLEVLPDGFVCSGDCENYDAILVRSANLLEETFPSSLKAVARAGAGTNNIPTDRLSQSGVCVFNTPGANANSVKELAVCALLLCARRISQGIAWVKSDPASTVPAVEKEKSRFAGHEIKGKTLSVFGLGAIGVLVANAAESLGMKVVGYDPYLSVRAAHSLSPDVKIVSDLDELFSAGDYITFHVPATPETRGIICEKNFAKMKDGVAIVNLSRGDLANASDVAKGLSSGKISAYATDFPSVEFASEENAVLIPHLGASTEEAEENCAVMAAEELTDYLLRGNVRNSVNYPALTLPSYGKNRYSLLSVSKEAEEKALETAGEASVAARASAERKGLFYTIFETEKPLGEGAKEQIRKTDGAVRLTEF